MVRSQRSSKACRPRARSPHYDKISPDESFGSSGAGRPPGKLVAGIPRTAHAAPSLPRGDGSGSEVSLSQLLEHRLVQLRLGQELLETAVLSLELFEALGDEPALRELYIAATAIAVDLARASGVDPERLGEIEKLLHP